MEFDIRTYSGTCAHGVRWCTCLQCVPELDRLRAENERLRTEDHGRYHRDCKGLTEENERLRALAVDENGTHFDALALADRYRDALRALVEALDCEDNNRGDVRDRALDRARALLKEVER